MKRLAHVIGIVITAAVVAACGSSSSTSSTQPASSNANCPSPGARFQLAAAGTVAKAPANGTMTVHDARKNTDVTVNYDPSVTVRSGRQTESISNVKVGDLVGIQGQQSGNSVHASAIVVRPAGAPSPGQGQGFERGRRAGCPPPQGQGG